MSGVGLGEGRVKRRLELRPIDALSGRVRIDALAFRPERFAFGCWRRERKQVGGFGPELRFALAVDARAAEPVAEDGGLRGYAIE